MCKNVTEVNSYSEGFASVVTDAVYSAHLLHMVGVVGTRKLLVKVWLHIY